MLMKNKLNDNRADITQYEQDIAVNFVLSMYKKYALAAAMEVVVPSNCKRPYVSLIPKGKLFALKSTIIVILTIFLYVSLSTVTIP